MKLNLDNLKTLSTDFQLLLTDGKHLKSSFKLQFTNKSAFHTLIQISISIMKATLDLFKIHSNTLKSFSILHWCQLTNAPILVPTTTTQTPLGTTISPLRVVGNYPDYHTLATTIGNHPDFQKFLSNHPF